MSRFVVFFVVYQILNLWLQRKLTVLTQNSLLESLNFLESRIMFHRLATTAVKQLPPDVIAAAQNNALWNKEEELILANVPAVSKSYTIIGRFTQI